MSHTKFDVFHQFSVYKHVITNLRNIPFEATKNRVPSHTTLQHRTAVTPIRVHVHRIFFLHVPKNYDNSKKVFRTALRLKTSTFCIAFPSASYIFTVAARISGHHLGGSHVHPGNGNTCRLQPSNNDVARICVLSVCRNAIGRRHEYHDGRKCDLVEKSDGSHLRPTCYFVVLCLGNSKLRLRTHKLFDLQIWVSSAPQSSSCVIDACRQHASFCIVVTYGPGVPSTAA
jgi:hypothetical protein